MKPMLRFVFYGLIYVHVMMLGISDLHADTVSWPVSVAIPTGMVGDLNSKPVSVVIPTGIAGDLNSKPVSVAIPTATIGGVYEARPSSVNVQPANLGDPDLVGLWHMDGDWGDSSGNGNNGLPYNGLSFSNTNIVGTSSANFNGTNNYVNVKYSALIANLPQSSVEAWVYPSSLGCASGSDGRTIYSENIAGGTTFLLNMNCSGYVSLGIWRTDVTGNWVWVQSSSVLIPNNWYHVVGTLDSTGMKIYVNNLPPSINLVNKPSNATITEVGIGRINNNGGRNYFNGLIDEVAIYKRALSADEIAQHYASGISATNAPASPVLDTVPAIVGTNSITLSGTRPAGTSIWVNNKKIAASDAATTWQGSYTNLQPGNNLLNITALDEVTPLQSQSVSRSVFYDNIPPVIESSIPANNSNTVKAVNSISITLYDANAGVDLNATMAETKVRNSAGQIVPCTPTTSGGRTIILTPTAALPADTYTITIQATDLVGNKQQQQISFATYDTSAPTTKATISGTKDSAGWYSTPVTVTLMANDTADGSGIAKVEYSLDSGATWQTYATPITFSDDGKTTLQFRATDNVGNVETAKSQEIKINKTGLVGWWKMDGDWKDSSVVGNDLIPTNGPTFSPVAHIGSQSGSFNGSNTFCSISTAPPSLDLTTNFTIMGWIYPESLQNWGGILDRGQETYASWELTFQTNQSILFAQNWNRSQGVESVGSMAGSVPINTWTQFALVYTDKRIFIYINGQQDSNTPKTFNNNPVTSSSDWVEIGVNRPGGDEFFNGLLDDVRIYNRALSATEIMEQYRNVSIGIPTVNPVATPVNTPTITISGTKPANSSIVITSGNNSAEIAPQSDAAAWAAETWAGEYTLVSGTNNLNITAKDADGFHSQPATLTVALDDTAPVVSTSTPANHAIFNATVSTITINLTDTFSPLDLAATVAQATVRNSSDFDVAGTWTTSGTGMTGTATFNADSPMGEGTYTAVITPTDGFGNNAPATVGFTVDMTAPVPPTINAIASPTNSTAKTITGTKSNDSTRVVVSTTPGATIGTPSYPTATTWSVLVSGLHDGAVTVNAYAVDAAGNPSGSVSAGFLVDTVAPARPIIDPPATPTNKSAVTLTGSKDANTYLYVKNVKTSVPFADTAWSSDVTLSEGSNSIAAYVKDEAGNQSQSATVTVVRDTTAPTIAASTPTANAVSGTVDSVSITLTGGTATPDLQATLAQTPVVKNAAGTTIAGTWAISGDAIVFTPTATLPEGIYTVTVYPADVLGNKGSASLSFTVDRGPPTVFSLTTSPSSPVKAGSTTFTLAFSENMNTGVQPQVTFGTAAYAVTGSWTDSKTWRGSYLLTTTMGDGAYTVTVKGAKDVAGNTMADQTAGSFVLDTIVPAAPTVAAVTALTKTTTQLLSGTKPADTAIVINNKVRVALGSTLDWSYSYPLAEGPNTLTITARDAAGNDSAAIAPAPVITLDTTPPLFTVDVYKTPSPTADQVISGKKEPGCIVKLNGTQIFDAADQNGDWSYTLNLVDGISNHYVFTAVDTIGNITTKTLDILYDSAPPPALGSGVLVADGSGKGNEVTLTWPAYPEPTALAYYRVFQGSADFAAVTGLTPVTTVNKGTKTFKVTGLTKGTPYYFAVVPVSTSGNSDPTIHTTSAIPADTLPPEDVTAMSTVAGYTLADGNTITLRWTASANTMGDLADQILYVDDGKGYDGGTSLGSAATTIAKKGLNDAALYKLKVTAKDTLGHESAGTVATAVTRLANPVGLAAVPGSGKATLTWQPVASPYVKYYYIYRVKSDTPQSDVTGMPLVKSQTTTSFTDTGLDNDSTYQYAVTVLNTSGAERTGVQSIGVTPRGDTTGPTISGLNLTPNKVVTAPFSITASAADAESAMDRIELYIDAVKVATVQGGTLAWTWNVVDTTDGNHTVKIAAYDAPGNKSETSVPVVVSLEPPQAPIITTTFSGPIAQRTVTVAGTNQAGATVFLRLNGVVVTQQVTAGPSFTFSGVELNEGDNYISVKAANRGGESQYSIDLKISVITTAPSAPTTLAAKQLAAGSLQFTWQAGATGAANGYNLYEVPATFGSLTDPGVRKTNTSLITYLLKEYIPADDTQRSYVVTAVDAAGNESDPSNLVTVASDRATPAVSVSFTTDTGSTPADNTYGSGSLAVSLTVSEPLKEMPFLSLEPQSGSPVVVALQKSDDTHYAATLTIDATLPHGSTVWKFSGKDMVGNRSNIQGTGPIFDVKGPQATVTAPLGLLKTIDGPVPVTVTLDEASTITPVMTLTVSDGSSAPIGSLASADNIHWSGTLDPAGLGEGTGRFNLLDARDRFGNRGNIVTSGAAIIVFRDAPPAPSVPMGLTAKAFKRGEVRLAWMPVTDAQGYTIYRKGTDDPAPVAVGSIPSGSTTAYSEIVTQDGSYAYSISSIGLLNSESAQSAPVTVVTDATPPPMPAALMLSMTGNGVKAEWQPGTGENAPYYRLYRSTAPIGDIAGLSPVATVTTPTAYDPSPDSAKRFYAVTSMDSIGNESAPSGAPEFVFPVMPVRNLVLSRVDDGSPSLSWEAGEANLQGFFIYRNGNKINQVPTTSTSFSDGYYSGGSVTYGVSAVNGLGTESPVREAVLPELTVGLKEGSVLRRGVLENVVLTAAQPATATTPLTMDSVALKIGTLPESSENGPFVIPADTPLEITKVAATEATAPPQTAVVLTAVLKPQAGVIVKIIRSVLAGVIASGSPLEIFNEPLVRGTQAKVRIKITNTGSARLEFVSSENNGPSSQVRILLKDQDGNLLAQGKMNQRTGSQVVSSGTYATVRLEPGESFLSDPITFIVPATAPYKVSLETAIDATYFHYKQDDQVTAPGLQAALDGTIADVSYMASAVTDKSAYKQGESIVISGTATATADGLPMADVPVKIGISVKGFDRFATVNSDSSGTFSYTFTPGANETGGYSVWASHPDLTDRTVQAQFSIIGLQISPLQATIRLLRGQSYDIPIKLVNLGGSPLSNLTLTTDASSGITATVPNPGSTTLNAGESRTVSLRVGAEQGAPASGFASLDITTGEGLGNRVDASITTITAIPVIATTPSYTDTGIMRGNQRIESLMIRNTGAETLLNPRIEGPSLPWLALTVGKNIGDIPAGQSRTVGILIKPDETVAQGIYNDRLVIYSDNHIPYTYNVQVTVTSSAVGSVQFSVLDELMEDVAGASISIQHQSLSELYYTLKTDAKGTASLFDIPEGRYTVNISAPGHKAYSCTVVIVPGITVSAPIALEVTLVTVEWSVTPVIIEDRYEITVSQTFETNVPTSVIVTEPPAVFLPNLAPGQVFNGEFTITNYGLVSADFGGMEFPSSFEDYDLEVLSQIPSTIGANQKIVVPYRITRRQQTASVAIGDEITGYGGDSCSGSKTIKMIWTQIICPYSLNERKVTRTTTYTISWNTCPISPAGPPVGGTPPVATYGSGTGTATMSSGGALPGGTGSSTSLPDPQEKCIYPCRPNQPPQCPLN